MKFFGFIIIFFLFAGCATHQISTDQKIRESNSYQNRSELSGSFFKKSENNFSDSQIKKLLTSKVSLASSVKLAFIKLSHHWVDYSRFDRSSYRDEMSIDKSNQAVFMNIVKRSSRVKGLSIVPTFLVPNEFSIANLRDTAALMQANYLVIVKTNSSSDFKFKFFSKNEATATANMEVGVVDVLSGAIPYTSLITGKVKIEKDSKEDFNSRDFQKRGRTAAEGEAYKILGENLIQLFNSKKL